MGKELESLKSTMTAVDSFNRQLTGLGLALPDLRPLIALLDNSERVKADNSELHLQNETLKRVNLDLQNERRAAEKAVEPSRQALRAVKQDIEQSETEYAKLKAENAGLKAENAALSSRLQKANQHLTVTAEVS